MGLGSSKVDTYVLKVIDDSVRDMEMTHRKSKHQHQPLSASDSHIKQQQQRGSMNRKNSKVSVQHAASLSDLDAHSDMIEGPHFLQKKSGTGLIGGFGAGISSKHMNNDDDTNNDVSPLSKLNNNHHHQHHHHNSHSNNLSGSPLQNHHQHHHHSPHHNNNNNSSSSSINQSSSKLITRANSIISHSSSKYPWLMKNTNLNGTTLNDYESGKVIGSGLMGTVRITKSKKNNKYFVLKGIKKDFIVKHNDQRHIINEKEVLKTLNSSFCVKLLGTFQDKSNVYFALEYCPGGELFARLGRKKAFPLAVAKFYASEIFVAIEHVQERGYVYRDLKPENVLIDEEGHIKLVDFGFSCPCSDNTTKLHTLCGTPAYLSPEQLDGKFTNGYTRVVDWWSYGVLVYELLTGKTPFCKNNKESHYEIFLRILKMKISFPWIFDSIAKDFITKLCHTYVDKRLCTADDIKVHKFFEISWENVKARHLLPPFVPRIREDGDIHYFRSRDAHFNNSSGDNSGEDFGFFDF